MFSTGPLQQGSRQCVALARHMLPFCKLPATAPPTLQLAPSERRPC